MVLSIDPPVQLTSLSLETYLLNPPDNTEWVDGEILEKTGMTLKTGLVQSRLSHAWINYKDNQNLGGEVYVEALCRTSRQARRPDIAYLTPDLVTQFGDLAVLPQSFPLIAEIVTPTDGAEDVFSKANEYLESGCLEVWLVMPESGWIAVLTEQARSLFAHSDTASTQRLLPGFSIAVQQLVG